MNQDNWTKSLRSSVPLVALDITGSRFVDFGLVIFLDFDGVLHHVNADSETFFEKSLHLIQALEYSDPEEQIPLVVSSNWRLTNALGTLKETLPDPIARRIIGVTPDLIDSSPSLAWNNGNSPSRYRVRQREIETWMSTYSPAGKWLAIDDIASGFEEQSRSLIHVAGETRFSNSPGLNESHEALITQKIEEMIGPRNTAHYARSRALYE